MPAVRNCGGVVLPSGVRALSGRIVMAILLSRCTDNARFVACFVRDEHRWFVGSRAMRHPP
jgi:hypothetical protein